MPKKDAVLTVAPVADETGKHTGLTIVVKGAGTIAVDFSKIHASNMAYAAFHGFKQRFVDAAALPADEKTGKPAPTDEKFEAILALVEHYEGGSDQWTRVSKGAPRGGVLFEALCRVFGHQKAPSEIRAWLDALSDKEAMAIREDDAVAPVIAAIKKERRAAEGDNAVDTAGLLKGLTATTPAPTDAPDAQPAQ